MTTKHILALLLVAMPVFGILDARPYRRTALLNVGIIMFAIAAVPYYLVRSRPAERKGRALLRLTGFSVLLVVACAAGGVAYGSLA